MDDHLGTQKEINDFAKEMLNQLEIHKTEKDGLRYEHPRQIQRIVVEEIEKRLEGIEGKDWHEVVKQCIHTANYLLMLWLKAPRKKPRKSKKNK